MTNEQKWSETRFAVQATSTEQHFLWCRHSTESDWRSSDYPAVKWDADVSGYCDKIGELDGRPVCVSVFWNFINGVRVAFYEPVSEVVDWVMVEDWLGKMFGGRWDAGTRRAHCDAMNFHHCLSAIEEMRQD